MRRQQRAVVLAASYRGGRAGPARARFVRRMDGSQAIDPAGRDRDRSEGNLVHGGRRRSAAPEPKRAARKALDDAIVALYQNGEPLMPGNGFPMRLLLPGYEGNMNVKYLRRIKLLDRPEMSFYESKVYTAPLPSGKAYRFYFVNEVKSFITNPSPRRPLQEPGLYEISGIAYSGKGRISKVMGSADGVLTWAEAALQQPVLSMAFTRFRMPWRWSGGAAVLQSRASDEDGNSQPTRAQLVAARGALPP